MQHRLRFAPSPTGQVHIGNIRTAIFNWLAARHMGGKFILRIEDTDLERSTKEAIDTLLGCMEWLGLDYDEEVLYQTSQAQHHLEAARKLMDEGNAYLRDPATPEHSPILFRIPFFCDEFPFVRTVGPASLALAPDSAVAVNGGGLEFTTLSPKGKPAENQACLAGFKDLRILDAAGQTLFELSNEKINALLGGATETVEHAASMTFTRREVFYDDMVKGHLSKPLDSMRDFIIVRSDGSPVFHLANVCDDITQGITLIVRGDDHVENTYRHLFMFRTLGAQVPSYAHLPMIVNAQGKPYSKRDGDAFVGDFRDKGVLPEALFNYLTLLGWSSGDNREKMSRAELVEAFDLARVQHSPAQFDAVKMANLNGQYIAALDPAVFRKRAWEFAAAYPWRESVDRAKFDAAADLMQSRTKLMTDLAAWTYFFAVPVDYDPKGVKKFLAPEAMRAALSKAADAFDSLPENDPKSVEDALRAVETADGLSQFALNQPVRVAVCGVTVGASIYETVVCIGVQECARRIRAALAATA
jgi:glutamyl-tRNA synthetase